MRKQLKRKLNSKKEDSNSSSEDEQVKAKPLDYDALKEDPEQIKQRGKKRKLTKDQVFNIWKHTLKDVPEDYDFVLTS